MNENDTIKLLRECDSGVKMGVAAINDVLPEVKSEELRDCLLNCRNQHEVLQKDIKNKLSALGDNGKSPAPIVKGMAHVKTSVKLTVENSDNTVADIMTNGCNMGVKLLHRYLNLYSNADADSRGIARRLIDVEDNLAKDMRRYL